LAPRFARTIERSARGVQRCITKKGFIPEGV
jgi:hypothetical protein